MLRSGRARMTPRAVERFLKAGAVIRHGNFSGYCLVYGPNEGRNPFKPHIFKALEEAGKIVRRDDASSVCGQEWVWKS